MQGQLLHHGFHETVEKFLSNSAQLAPLAKAVKFLNRRIGKIPRVEYSKLLTIGLFNHTVAVFVWCNNYISSWIWWDCIVKPLHSCESGCDSSAVFNLHHSWHQSAIFEPNDVNMLPCFYSVWIVADLRQVRQSTDDTIKLIQTPLAISRAVSV